MAKAYSDDLRRKVLEAHAAGEGILEELAERFRVSVSWVYKISAALGKTGKMERQPGAKRGRVSKVTPAIENFIQEAIQRRSDITLAELQLKLFEQRQLEISIGRLWQVVDRLEHFQFKCGGSRRVSAVAEEGGGLVWSQRGQSGGEGSFEPWHGPFFRCPQVLLELGPAFLDRIKVWRVGRQVE